MLILKYYVATCAIAVSLIFIFNLYDEIPFSPKVSDAYAEDTKQTVTIKDAKQQAAEEAGRVDEHTATIKKGVKKDTSAAAQTIFGGIKSGFKILKDGFGSLRRGEGVPVDQTPMEDREP